MPRPLKSVPADTLGGRIRAARQRLRLSLSQVAGETYSTSLISQIERNKIEPSAESLKYLAERLNLSLDDLTLLAQQRRESEAESSKYQQFEDQRALAAQLLEMNRPRQALAQIAGLVFTEIPTYLRWRIVALRGQCYFATREFRQALADFLAAVVFLPRPVAQEQTMDVVLLFLHLAATLRELGQYDAAFAQYTIARSMMDFSTPLRYVAEAHWGTSLVLYEQAYKAESERDPGTEAGGQASPQGSAVFREYLDQARKHAENARSMYQSANELLRAALLNCQLALIEQALHQLDSAQQRLQAVLDDWLPTLSTPEISPAQPAPGLGEKQRRYTEKERANVVSAAACYLASVERDAHHYEQAMASIDLALEIGARTYILRRADAYMTKGQILADLNDQAAIDAFKQALEELKDTDRVGAIIRVHKMLGAYLIRQGQKEAGEAELEKAFALASVPSQYSATAANENTVFPAQDGESFINT
jgi:transcriptional regulator with XRE-family HTH domain